MGLVTERSAEIWRCADCELGVGSEEGYLEGEDNNNGGLDKRTAVLKMIVFYIVFDFIDNPKVYRYLDNSQYLISFCPFLPMLSRSLMKSN